MCWAALGATCIAPWSPGALRALAPGTLQSPARRCQARLQKEEVGEPLQRRTIPWLPRPIAVWRRI